MSTLVTCFKYIHVLLDTKLASFNNVYRLCQHPQLFWYNLSILLFCEMYISCGQITCL